MSKVCGKYTRLGVIWGMSMILSACGYQDRQALVRQHVQVVKMKKSYPIEPIPQFKPLEKFIYPENKIRRSPFKARQHQMTAQVMQPDMLRPKQPLENYPLDALKFVGTLGEGVKKWALIRDPNGQIVKISVGDYMGQNYGKVIAVNNTALILEERRFEEDTWVKHMVTFHLETVTMPQDVGKK